MAFQSIAYKAVEKHILQGRFASWISNGTICGTSDTHCEGHYHNYHGDKRARRPQRKKPRRPLRDSVFVHDEGQSGGKKMKNNTKEEGCN